MTYALSRPSQCARLTQSFDACASEITPLLARNGEDFAQSTVTEKLARASSMPSVLAMNSKKRDNAKAA
jgi:hypothetical protein